MARRSILTAYLIVCAGLFFLAVPSGCLRPEEQSERPDFDPKPIEPTVMLSAAEPIADPPSGPSANRTQLPAAAPADETPLEAVERILTLTPTEMDTLQVAQRHKDDFRETAFYETLDRASRLPQLTPEQVSQLPRPMYSSLINNPGPYVGRPIRMNVLVYSVFKEVSGVDIEPDLLWPAGRETWMIRCYNADSKVGQQGMLIVSTVDPLPLLHQPISDPSDPLKIFNPAIASLEVAGVFYKVFVDLEAGDPKHPELSRVTEFPLIIAWDLRKTSVKTPESIPTMLAAVIFLAVAVMVIIFYFLMRQVRRLREQPILTKGGAGRSLWLGRYRPLRDVTQDSAYADAQEDDGQVDPELKAAVDEWHKEHSEDKQDG